MIRRASLDQPPVFHLAARDGARLTLASDTGAVAHVFVLEEDLVRLAVLPNGAFNHPRTWTIAPGAEDVPADGRDRYATEGFACPVFRLDDADPGRLTVETAHIRLEIGLTNLACRWFCRLNGAWAQAARDRPTQAYDFGWWDGTPRHYLVRAPDERYFGLGERSGPMDRAGRRLRLGALDAMGYDARTSDPLYKHIPFYITRRRSSGLAFGLFYDTFSDGVFDFGQEHSNYHGPYRYFAAEHGDLDLYVLGGPAVADVVRRFTWLTGRPAATPNWALGYSGSSMGYADAPNAQARMAGFLDDLARHDIPCGSFHLSSGYTSIGVRRHVFHWNREKFPDPAAFVAAFEKAGVKILANIKPALLTDHPVFGEAARAGLLLADADGEPVLEPFWDGACAYLDFTNPATAAWWKARVTDSLLNLGIAATWNDNNEFEITGPRALAHGFGRPFPAREMKPLQTLLMLRASREAQLQHAPEAPPFLISRAGFAGMQRYAQTWSGDNVTSWESLKWNIPMGLGLSLSGVSNIGHDIGGFAGPAPDPELFARWVGLGVFLPRFSIHSWNDDGTVNAPWMHPEVLDDIRALMRLRQRLIPHIATLLARHREAYEPVMRPLFHDFPDEEAAWAETDDFLLGSAMLVCPITAPGVVSRPVRLPAGARWRDGWTGEVFKGGETIERAAPFDRPPFLIRLDAPGGEPPGDFGLSQVDGSGCAD
jgi:alpha-glucosidase